MVSDCDGFGLGEVELPEVPQAARKAAVPAAAAPTLRTVRRLTSFSFFFSVLIVPSFCALGALRIADHEAVIGFPC
jgi:hypothetical protein